MVWLLELCSSDRIVQAKVKLSQAECRDPVTDASQSRAVFTFRETPFGVLDLGLRGRPRLTTVIVSFRFFVDTFLRLTPSFKLFHAPDGTTVVKTVGDPEQFAFDGPAP